MVPQIPRNSVPRNVLAPLQTNGYPSRNVRYSYTATPSELHRPEFHQYSSPPNSTIDESPVFPHGDMQPNNPVNDMDARYVPETASISRSGSPYNFKPPQEVHPALYAPYAEPPQQSERALPAKQPQSPGPIPIKTHLQPISPTVPIHISNSEENKAGVAHDVDPSPLIYNPNSLAGPNVNLGNHRPGQVSHPNAAVEPNWKHGLCEFDTLCCAGVFCPCTVYGKTQYRLSKKAQKQEPTDLLGYETCNGSCGVMAVACGLQWIFAAVQRTRVRKLYQLNGSLGDDCIKSICCCCCVIMQDEREVRDREELIRRHAGPAIGAYSLNPTMSFAPPPR